MGGARKRQESRPDFTSPRKIYVNYQFRGSCPIFLSLKVYPSDNWVRLTYASRSGTGGFYADYRKDNDLWRTTAPYVYIMAQPISQDELTSVAERLRATNGLEPYKVWLTPNDEGGAFTPTIKCE